MRLRLNQVQNKKVETVGFHVVTRLNVIQIHSAQVWVEATLDLVLLALILSCNLLIIGVTNEHLMHDCIYTEFIWQTF